MSRAKSLEVDAAKDRRFDSIFDQHHADVLRYCLRRLGKSDGEDAAAEVFAVAWRRLDEVPADDMARVWLFGVAYRVVGNQYRSRDRRSRLIRRLGGLRDSNPPYSEESSPATMPTEILRAVESLRAGDREILQMVAWDGLTRGEIANVLGIRENAVDQRLFRARARLRQRLEQLGISNIEPQEASS